MDKSLKQCCETLKKIIGQLRPLNPSLSFLLIIGKLHQGKSALLNQGEFTKISVTGEDQIHIYYNQQGIIIEINESWLNKSNNLLQFTLQQFNRCYHGIKINGLMLCIDIRDLFIVDPQEFSQQIKAHTELLTRFGNALGYRVPTTLIFTKLDVLAGFCDFFYSGHDKDLQTSLGFSLAADTHPTAILDNYRQQFDQLIDTLSQQIIHKIHPVRSSIKRTLIREFPLQLASIRHALLSCIKNINPTLFQLQSIYFTSAEQSGNSLDRLNRKIKEEYALSIQEQCPQSVNFRAYFIDGALSAFQTATKCQVQKMTRTYLLSTWLLVISACGVLIFIANQHFKSSHLLTKVNQELSIYDKRRQLSDNQSNQLYHLTKAYQTLQKMPSTTLSISAINSLHKQLRHYTNQSIQLQLLPQLINELEQNITDTTLSYAVRYQALKTYLMLGDPQHFSKTAVLSWFEQRWQKNLTPHEKLQQLALLKQIFTQPLPALSLNQHIIRDLRNFFNALPPSYIYYSLAKTNFSQETTTLKFAGFQFAQEKLPKYVTKQGFQTVMTLLPKISEQYVKENWVLKRQDLDHLATNLEQAYCEDYIHWWRQLIQLSNPIHSQTYTQARQLSHTLTQAQSMQNLLQLIQQNTSPLLHNHKSLFNRSIANQFAELNLVSMSTVQHISTSIEELGPFLSTLSIVNDHGQTAFNIVKSIAQNQAINTPLATLYNDTKNLPAPLSTWTKQVADDALLLLMSDSREYINQQWQRTVFQEYQNTIANRYPFDPTQSQEISMADFDRFFSHQGTLRNFVDTYLKPFLDTSQPQWHLKATDNYVLPISQALIDELIRANIITYMFFPNQQDRSQVTFSLEKISLDPVVASLRLSIGNNTLSDTQNTESKISFQWPQTNASLTLDSIDGNHYVLEETGPWAFFKILQKVNVLQDDQDPNNLQILFEINGNSGRYLLKTNNQINPFAPGILSGFTLTENIA